MNPTPELKALINRFQCPGCLKGSGTDCGSFDTSANHMSCSAHVLGTLVFPVGYFALGMPKGFCRPGFGRDREPISTMSMRLWVKGTAPEWDKLNVPVWALEADGFLYVRTALPRVAAWITDVIEGGTLALCPQAIDVSHFYDEFD